MKSAEERKFKSFKEEELSERFCLYDPVIFLFSNPLYIVSLKGNRSESPLALADWRNTREVMILDAPYLVLTSDRAETPATLSPVSQVASTRTDCCLLCTIFTSPTFVSATSPKVQKVAVAVFDQRWEKVDLKPCWNVNQNVKTHLFIWEGCTCSSSNITC